MINITAIIITTIICISIIIIILISVIYNYKTKNNNELKENNNLLRNIIDKFNNQEDVFNVLIKKNAELIVGHNNTYDKTKIVLDKTQLIIQKCQSIIEYNHKINNMLKELSKHNG